MMSKKILITIGILIIAVVLLVGCNFVNYDDRGAVDLSQVKVASLFERVPDYAAIGKSVDDVITELKETRTDFIFRGFWKWAPCPDAGGEYGYDYQNLRNTINQIKEEMPEVIFCGAIPAQYIPKGEINPKTGLPFTILELEAMELDLSKKNINILPEEWEKFKEFYQQGHAGGYFPDLTNPDVQELLVDWAKKQIDCGADAIWIDGFFAAPSALVKFRKIEANHPFVEESLDAASKVIEEIHKYGESEHQKHIYVGSWVTFLDFPYSPPNFDFVTATPTGKEIKNKNLDNQKWHELALQVRNKMGQNFPFFVFIDWSSKDDTPLAVFSQQLSTSEQNEILEKMDKFLQDMRLVFVYPVHGGYMGEGATKLTYNKYKTYNSVYFNNYETIKKLAQTKKGY